MKSIRVILAFLLTFTVIVGGFFLPSSTFSYQNKKYLSNSDSCAIEQTQFYYTSNLQDTLYLMQNDKLFLVNNYHTYNYSESEVVTLCHDIIEALSRYDIHIDPEYTTYMTINRYYMLEQQEEDYSPYFDNETNVPSASSSDSLSDDSSNSFRDTADEHSFSSYVWRIYLTSKSEMGKSIIELLLDDETGKLIAFSYEGIPRIFNLSHDMPKSVQKKDDLSSRFNYIARNLIKFLASHYEFTGKEPSLICLETDYINEHYYNCVFIDENNSKIETPLYMTENGLYYNYPSSYY